MEGDPQEVVELERIADWRIGRLGEDPGDAASAAAAALLQKLAGELRTLAGSPAYAEYRAICGWLDEYEGMGDFAERAGRDPRCARPHPSPGCARIFPRPLAGEGGTRRGAMGG